ncbi:hypothetical protein PCE1_004627 [Barthelona sp. PCE]
MNINFCDTCGARMLPHCESLLTGEHNLHWKCNNCGTQSESEMLTNKPVILFNQNFQAKQDDTLSSLPLIDNTYPRRTAHCPLCRVGKQAFYVQTFSQREELIVHYICEFCQGIYQHPLTQEQAMMDDGEISDIDLSDDDFLEDEDGQEAEGLPSQMFEPVSSMSM